jgi:hypothetical protein
MKNRPNIHPMFQKSLALALTLGVLTITGCRTIPSTGVEAFSAGTTAAKTQSEEAFRAVNDLIAQDQLEDAAKATNLTEALFNPVLGPENVAIWDQTLAKLESYAHHLQNLTSPDLTKSFEEQAETLGADLQGFGQHLKDAGLISKSPQISPGVATAFTELGSLIIRSKAQHNALRIMSAANSNTVAALRTMSADLGETSMTGLRGTVRTHWNGRLGAKKEEFKKQNDDAAKRKIVSQFVDLMGLRDAQDAMIASLRRSLLSLADLHQSLARGEAVTARQFAQTIADEIKATREIYAQYKDKLKP